MLAGRQAALLGGLGDLVAVLVGAREEEDVVAKAAMMARQDVGGDRRVGVAQVGSALT